LHDPELGVEDMDAPLRLDYSPTEAQGKSEEKLMDILRNIKDEAVTDTTLAEEGASEGEQQLINILRDMRASGVDTRPIFSYVVYIQISKFVCGVNRDPNP
jgi:hypothetical protein